MKKFFLLSILGICLIFAGTALAYQTFFNSQTAMDKSPHDEVLVAVASDVSNEYLYAKWSEAEASNDTTNYVTISVSADPPEGGNVTGGGRVESGTSVTVEAKPNRGYEFVQWSDTSTGNAVSTSQKYTFSARSDLSLLASFESSTESDPERIFGAAEDLYPSFFYPKGLEVQTDELFGETVYYRHYTSEDTYLIIFKNIVYYKWKDVLVSWSTVDAWIKWLDR
ncbi:InlB B-repeat-containing protein [Desulfonatronovibrio magnus]|uniref:InlB B-repeat-containing protein n=1 Tax=Desulfonatronovibrio magnus TaxID=698827 RepID=UPI0005EB176A|nr:hypothetical protein [Desulfonatronovibrio magnus]